MLSSLHAYGRFIYTLQERFPVIQRSTLIVIPLGATMGSVRGTLEFEYGISLRVVEEIDFQRQQIEYYSYTVSRNDERLYWYDPQPHPNDPSLAPTHPHHKHIPPNIKRNRIPAPVLSFTRQNLSALIDEVEQTLLSSKS